MQQLKLCTFFSYVNQPSIANIYYSQSTTIFDIDTYIQKIVRAGHCLVIIILNDMFAVAPVILPAFSIFTIKHAPSLCHTWISYWVQSIILLLSSLMPCPIIHTVEANTHPPVTIETG